MNFAAVFFGRPFLRDCEQLEIRRLLPNHQPIIAPSLAERAVEQIAHLNAAGSVILRFEATDRIERTGLEFIPADVGFDVVEFLVIDHQ